MMNRKIGFLGSYWLGLDPSKMPPWGVARRVGDGEATATEVVEDMATTLLEVVVLPDGMMHPARPGASIYILYERERAQDATVRL